VKFVGYTVGSCEGVELNKRVVIECDDLHAHIQAGEVDIVTFDPAHIALIRSLFGQMVTRAADRRDTLADRFLSGTDRLVSGPLSLGLLAIPLFLIGF
jgi:hypothetical protein